MSGKTDTLGQYPDEQVIHDSTKQRREDFAAQLWSTMNQNPGKVVTVPMFKPWNSGKVDEFTPTPKGKYEGLGYRSGTADPIPYGKVYLAEVVNEDRRWDQPVAVKITESVRALVAATSKL